MEEEALAEKSVLHAKGGVMAMVPFVITEREGKERQFDIFSLLLNDRIIFINGVIDEIFNYWANKYNNRYRIR